MAFCVCGPCGSDCKSEPSCFTDLLTILRKLTLHCLKNYRSCFYRVQMEWLLNKDFLRLFSVVYICFTVDRKPDDSVLLQHDCFNQTKTHARVKGIIKWKLSHHLAGWINDDCPFKACSFCSLYVCCSFVFCCFKHSLTLWCSSHDGQKWPKMYFYFKLIECTIF